jgi:hypothetical protein
MLLRHIGAGDATKLLSLAEATIGRWLRVDQPLLALSDATDVPTCLFLCLCVAFFTLCARARAKREDIHTPAASEDISKHYQAQQAVMPRLL